MQIIKALTLLFSVFLGTSIVQAQTPPAAPAANANLAKVLAQVPQEAVACLSVRLQQIKADQALRLLPWEIIKAASLDEIGVDLSELERIDLVVGPIAEQPGIGVILTGKDKLDLSSLNKEMFALEEDGKSYRMLGNRDLSRIRLIQLNEKQVLVGDVYTLPTYLNAPRGTGELHKQMQRLGENGHVSLVFVPEPIRPLLVQVAETSRVGDQPKVLVEKCQLIAARMQVDLSPTINILIETASPSDAEEFEKNWNSLVDSLVPRVMADISVRFRDPTIEAPMGAYIDRASTELTQLLHPTRKGTRLLLTIDQKTINLFRGLTTFFNFAELWRGSGQPGSINRGIGSPDMQKLKMIGLAMHNYHDAYKNFPMGGEFDKQNKPQLSWRVKILPYLGDPKLNELYLQFKLDEPWDSETNAKLVEKMPDIYRYSKAKVPPGHTVMQSPLGPGLISQRGKGVRIAMIIDGTSNSIMLALSKDEAAKPWTKPDDFNPLEDPSLIRIDNNRALLLIADGSVIEKTNPTAEELKALLTIDGGEPTGL